MSNYNRITFKERVRIEAGIYAKKSFSQIAKEIGIFSLNGDAYIKKLQNDKDGIFLISLNEKYAPIKVSENDRLDIFGKVLGKSDASAITGHCR